MLYSIVLPSLWRSAFIVVPREETCFLGMVPLGVSALAIVPERMPGTLGKTARATDSHLFEMTGWLLSLNDFPLILCAQVDYVSC